MDGALGTSTDRSLTKSFSMLSAGCCASVMGTPWKENRSLKLRERGYFTRASRLPIPPPRVAPLSPTLSHPGGEGANAVPKPIDGRGGERDAQDDQRMPCDASQR